MAVSCVLAAPVAAQDYLGTRLETVREEAMRRHQQQQAAASKSSTFDGPVRTDSAWFHETLSPVADIYLLRGRVRFLDARGKGQHTPFSLMLVTLGANQEQKDRYAQRVPGFWIAPRAAA